MRILGLETSSLYGSVAVTAGDSRVIGHALSRESRTAQSLAPAIRSLLENVRMQPCDLDVIAVTTGPGSFTGLRIGVTTAKTLAFAVGARLIGINTLEALALAAAEQLRPGEAVMPLIDAHRNQLFTARYRKQTDGSLLAETEVEILDIDPWLAGPVPEVWLSGPALRKLGGELQGHWPQVRMCDQSLWTPSANQVVQLARRKAVAGEFADVFGLLPQYYRPSYAEEKAAK